MDHKNMQQESDKPVTPGTDSLSTPTSTAVAEDKQWLAQTYHPLPVVISSARGTWVEDIEGKRYLDCLAGYSALNFGHANERIIVAARHQLDRLTMTSRAFYNDKLTDFARELATLAGADLVIPMNTGAEAVESAIKAARAWGYRVKGVEAERANIIVMGSNFHGRTTTIVSFSDDPDARDDFGPYTPGFRQAKFGDANSVASLMDDNTVAVLVEPIQGEAGVIIPPDGFMRRVRDLCTANNVLMIADEIQSGLGRTGTTFACELWGVKPDLMTLGKALGGGIIPVSAVVGRADVLGVLRPGQHGSTFGGNPLAAAVGLEVVRILAEGTFQEAARTTGESFKRRLEELTAKNKGISAYTHVGLWSGVSIAPRLGSGRQLCEAMLRRGVLAKDTHGSTVRLSPPLTITEEDLDFLFEAFEGALDDLAATNPTWRGRVDAGAEAVNQ
ncbi:MAG: ornithine--oxo-acid transaminase [Ancrocorticia sp.]